MRFVIGLFTAFLIAAFTPLGSLAQTNPAADLIVVVDTSGDMDDEVAAFQASINNVANTIKAAFIDLQVVVIADAAALCVPAPLGSGLCPNDSQAGLQHVDQAVGSNDALQKLIATYPQWAGSLRTNARKFILVVSSDDSDISASDFQTQLLALNPTFTGYVFNGIVAGPFTLLDPCALLAAAPGAVYMQLIASTGGILTNLCQGLGAIAPGLANIAQSIVATVGSGTPPPPPPSAQPVAGANAVVMFAKPTRGAGPTVVLNATVAGVDLEGTYTGEVSVTGEDSSVVQQNCTVSVASPTADVNNAGASRLRCTLSRLLRSVIVVYEVFGRQRNVSYLGEIRLRRGAEVAVEAGGVIRLLE